MSYKQLQKHAIHREEQGFASIAIALVMIVVLGLLTIGFAQLARREQQSALNKQLAYQAYDAAETGVNDITQAIQGGTINETTGYNVDTDHCVDDTLLPNKDINTATGVSYTCALIKLKLPSLVWSGVSPLADRSISFSTEGGSSLASLTVNWSSADNHGAPRPSGGFPPTTSWGNSPAVLQFSITPINSKSNITRDELYDKTFTAFLYPLGGAGTVVYNTGAQGQIVNGACNTDGCSVTISGIPSVSADGFYAVNLINYYDTSDISIDQPLDAGNTDLKFVDGQALVDVTGRARSALRRLQVRIPIRLPNQMAKYALDGQSICKRLQTKPAQTDFIAIDGSTVNAGSNACNLTNEGPTAP